jgi:nitroreductase
MKFDPSTRHQICSSADEALLTRQSIRAFLPREVPRETIDDILQVAARAPSGTNTQPWKVYVVAGEPRAELSRQILAAFDDPAVAATHKREYA